MTNIIGVKIASGDFYPIMAENYPVKRRLVLTTARNKQDILHIDLYRSPTKTMSDSQYIGSLVVDKLAPKTQGEASVEVIISANQDGQLVADAADLDKGPGERKRLNVSLKSLDEDLQKHADLDLSEFDVDLEAGIEPPTGLLESGANEAKLKRPKSRAFLAFVLGAVFGMLVSASIWFFFLGGRDTLSSQFNSLFAGRFLSQAACHHSGRQIVSIEEGDALQKREFLRSVDVA
ncbi:MAG: Hsp70 family protein [Spirochaetes bacterium]|nr:Hsp70 family protein [Spirochaetota bacterium]